MEAYVTLVTSSNYVAGASVLAHSLRLSGTRRSLVVLHTRALAHDSLKQLHEVFDRVVCVEELNSNDTASLALLGRPELGVTFTKLQVWNLLEYSKCVFIDADAYVLKNVDDLFAREELSAAPDVGWPDCFNSGVFVFVPSKTTFQQLLAFASQVGSFDGGDQGLLNQFFTTWVSDPSRRLPFTYNMTSNASYGYRPAFARFKDDIKIVHFAGAQKPWVGIPQSLRGTDAGALYERWWRLNENLLSCQSTSASYLTLMSAHAGQTLTHIESSSSSTYVPAPVVPSVSQGSSLHYSSAAVNDILSLIDERLRGAPAPAPVAMTAISARRKSSDSAEDDSSPVPRRRAGSGIRFRAPRDIDEDVSYSAPLHAHDPVTASSAASSTTAAATTTSADSSTTASTREPPK
eukprot:m.254874 g.254874  ORF g.254874 m.254874 type:complete len:405 (+) comp54540_c1_seq5:1895-3109(+)